MVWFVLVRFSVLVFIRLFFGWFAGWPRRCFVRFVFFPFVFVLFGAVLFEALLCCLRMVAVFRRDRSRRPVPRLVDDVAHMVEPERRATQASTAGMLPGSGGAGAVWETQS